MNQQPFIWISPAPNHKNQILSLEGKKPQRQERERREQNRQAVSGASAEPSYDVDGGGNSVPTKVHRNSGHQLWQCQLPHGLFHMESWQGLWVESSGWLLDKLSGTHSQTPVDGGGGKHAHGIWHCTIKMRVSESTFVEITPFPFWSH